MSIFAQKAEDVIVRYGWFLTQRCEAAETLSFYSFILCAFALKKICRGRYHYFVVSVNVVNGNVSCWLLSSSRSPVSGR